MSQSRWCVRSIKRCCASLQSFSPDLNSCRVRHCTDAALVEHIIIILYNTCAQCSIGAVTLEGGVPLFFRKYLYACPSYKIILSCIKIDIRKFTSFKNLGIRAFIYFFHTFASSFKFFQNLSNACSVQRDTRVPDTRKRR